MLLRKLSVVAHQENSAVVFHQHFLQEIEGIASKSFVGSSSTSTFEGFVKSFAKSARFSSPPERTFTGKRDLSGRIGILKVADYVPRLSVDRYTVVSVSNVVFDRFSSSS